MPMEKRINKIIEYWNTNHGGLCVYILVGSIMTYVSGHKDYFKAYLTLLVATCVTWIGHYLLHYHNTYNPIAKIHQITHHSPFADTILGKLIEYLFVEFFFFGGGILLILVLWIKNSYDVYILDPYVLLYWSIAVPVIHEVHYHILKITDHHSNHHKDQKSYFSPEFWDIMFETRDPDLAVENESLMAPTLIALAAIMIPFIGTKYDIIRYLSGNVTAPIQALSEMAAGSTGLSCPAEQTMSAAEPPQPTSSSYTAESACSSAV
jgi:hypothetical protein